MSKEAPRFLREEGAEEAVYVLRRLDKKHYALQERFRYVEPADGRTFKIPANCDSFKTDLASIPSPLTWLVPKDGTHTPAALLHDALVSEPGRPVDYIGPEVDRVEADRIFREAMAHLGVPLLRRWVMWSAVSLATFLGPRPGSMGRMAAVWRWLRILLVLAALGSLTVGALAIWTDALDVTWAILPWVEVAPRLPWMSDRSAAAEVAGAVALTGIAMAVVVGVSGLTKVVVRGSGQEPYLRVRSCAILVVALAVFCIPAVVAGAAWAFFQVVAEWVAFRIMKVLRRLPRLAALLGPANPVRVLGRYPLAGEGAAE